MSEHVDGTKKKKSTPEVKRKLEQHTFKLLSPITLETANITTIVMTEPLMHQVIQAARVEKKTGENRITVLIGLCSDLPKGVAKRIKSRDVGRVSKWMRKLSEDALKDDGLHHLLRDESEEDNYESDPFEIDVDLGNVSDEEVESLDSSRSFELHSPYHFDGRYVQSLTATEPTIETMTTATKFKLDVEASVAMVAGITGETFPFINRLTQRDFVRLETWLAPFVRDLMSSPSGGI